MRLQDLYQDLDSIDRLLFAVVCIAVVLWAVAIYYVFFKSEPRDIDYTQIPLDPDL